MLNFTTVKVTFGAAVLALALHSTLPAIAQDAADTPATTEEATPPADAPEAAAPAEAQPAETQDAAPSEGASDEAAPATESSDGAAPDTPAAAPASSVKAADLSLNAPVFGSDGKEVGTISRISSAADGSVDQIYVSTGSASVVIPGSAIAEAGANVKLTLSSEEVSKLPAPDDGND